MFTRAVFRIRNSISAFANTPAASLALVVTIAIGVGCNTIVGGFIAGLAHPQSPFATTPRIVSVVARGRLSNSGPLSEIEFQSIRSRGAEFAWVSALRIAPLDVAIDGRTETLTVAAVMPDLAKALSLNFRNGAVVSRHLGETDSDGENRKVPRQISINNTQLPISGVASQTLEGLYSDHPIDIWLPFDGLPQDAIAGRRDLWVFASLRPGVSPADAQRAIRAGPNKLDGVEVVAYSGTVPGTGRGLASIVMLLKFIAASVFLISCINVASLLLGRAFERSSETSLRVALGATRLTLSGDLLSDSVVIASAGGVLGLLLAIAAKRVIPGLLFQEDVEHLIFVLPVASLIASSIVCVTITVLAGMMPIIATATDRPWTVLQRDQGFSSTRVVRLRSALVVTQIALCCVLVIFATLLLQSFHDALKTGIGHTLGNPVLLTVGANPYLNFPSEYFEAVEKSARSVSDVAPVAWTVQLPGSRPAWQSFRIQPGALPLHEVVLDMAESARDSRDRPELPTIAGRQFEARDQLCRAVVADVAAAGALSGRATVGETILDPSGLPVEIIGIVDGAVGDIRRRQPTIYFDPLGSSGQAAMNGARFRAPAALSSDRIELNVNVVSSSYMQAFGLSLIGGEWFFDRAPFRDPCRRVGVINQEASDLDFGGKPLGTRIIDQDGSPIEIIGVVRSQSLGTFQRPAEPTVFLPPWQENPLRMTLVLKVSNPSSRKMTELLRKIESVPGQAAAPPDIKTLDTQLALTAFAPLRIATLIALTSALAALTVSMIGVFSIQSEVSRERRKVLALHLAFGAQRWRILSKSLLESGRLVFAGCVAGTLLSVALRRILLSETALIGQPPFRAWLFALLLPALAVLISGVLFALRSLGVQPMTAMRDR
jgi:ABC-type lipoprotein release transport system permease subunit